MIAGGGGQAPTRPEHRLLLSRGARLRVRSAYKQEKLEVSALEAATSYRFGRAVFELIVGE